MPFVGEITGRPSVLEGSIDNMIAQAKECLAKGIWIRFIDYQYTGNPVELNNAFVEAIKRLFV
ncbi:MAG: hypothetical protein ACLS3V_06280 [Streptococcus sp.]